MPESFMHHVTINGTNYEIEDKQARDDLENLDYLNLKTVQESLGVTERFYPNDLIASYSGSGAWTRVDQIVDDDMAVNKWCTIVVKQMMLSSVGKLRIYDAGFNVLLLDDITEPGIYKFKTNSLRTGIAIRMQVSTETIPVAGTYFVKGISIYNADLTVEYDPITYTNTVRDDLQLLIGNVSDSVSAVFDNTNYYDPSTVEDGKRINGNGGIQNHTGYYTSAMISVPPGVYVTKNSPIIDDYHRMAVYDSSGTFISGELYTDNIVLMPSNAAYIRICGKSEEILSAEVKIVSAADLIARNDIKELGESVQEAAQAISLLGSNGVITRSLSVAGSTQISIMTFPKYLKKNTAVTFYGKFNEFSGLKIGKGYNSYRGDWVEITSTHILFHHYESSDSVVKSDDAHGLNISDYIMVMLYLDADGKLNCSINTTDGTYSCGRETDYNVFCGDTFAIPEATMTDVELSVSNGDTNKPLWAIGDSYFGVNADRVLGQLKALGYWHGILTDGLAGLGSVDAYTELTKLLQFGTPKILIWYLGMNDTDANYLTCMTSVKQYCTEHNIILILNKVPSVPNRSKETIAGYVNDSECRYIDSYKAVGSSASGVWYTGYLNSVDSLHPTQLGAKALAMRMIIDVPEIMEYGFNQVSVSGDTTGDN